MMLLSLGGCDMVLGAQWLIKLRDISWNFDKLKMEFGIDGKKVAFRGMRSANVKIIGKGTCEKS